MIVVTGAAGFIGSAVIWGLNQRGHKDIVAVDDVKHPEKEHNLQHIHVDQRSGIAEFRQAIQAGTYTGDTVQAIIHLGANSSTTEHNWAQLEDNNVRYSQEVITWAVQNKVRCIYASSGAVYGKGDQGYSDDPALFDTLQPLNLYGRSKLLVDQWVRDQGYLQQVVGLRYFNVFGPNEYHKEHMRSVIAKKFDELQSTGTIELFRSYTPDYANGDFKRDFIYITDVVAATLFFLDHPHKNGVYNVGTGQARSWNDLATAMCQALGKKPAITYVDMPVELREQYQYFTQAEIQTLKAAGFGQTMKSLEDGVTDYLQQYLVPHRHLGEVA